MRLDVVGQHGLLDGFAAEGDGVVETSGVAEEYGDGCEDACLKVGRIVAFEQGECIVVADDG
ncbi:hypothetical protein [uncultured Duncaniella sp.]|uniref:hypothetical protein n=1 Tax=uncultured Duncaniella sp. TaxID=2768039 RepID=UPI0026312D67|nr:hypothetical protein [uncultured Duncaniella sp.]